MNKNIKFARIEKGITQKELARSVGISTNYMSMIEKRDATPSPKVMKRIADCLNTSVQKLFFD